MSHSHSHPHPHAGGSSERIALAFALNLSFAIIEVVGGILTNSVAIAADALHDFGDSLTLGSAWLLERGARRKSTERFTYGFGRLSLLSAFVTTLVLIGGSIYVIAESVPRFLAPEQPHAGGVMLLAVLGIVVNGAAVLRLRAGKTLSERALTWHLLEDVLGWVAVFVAGIGMYFFDLPILDPLLAVAFTIYVLWNTFRNLKKTVDLFLQATPDDVSVSDIEREITALSSVVGVRHTHVWSLDGERHILTTHVTVDANLSLATAETLKASIRTRLRELGISHATIEIEVEHADS